MKYLIACLCVVPFITGCATTPEEQYSQRQHWGNTIGNMGNGFMNMANQPAPQPTKYYYKDQYGRTIGSIDSSQY